MTRSTRRRFLTSTAAGLGALVLPRTARAEAVSVPGAISVADFGAVGDGKTPCADAFQAALDAAEARGGGVVLAPAGTYLLEKTPLIGSRVHLQGAGAATVLRGARPEGVQGAALISNKGQQAPGFEGAHDWSIAHLAIDSPDTNGIVVTHAERVELHHIYGIQAYHHFIDIVGRDVHCHNLFLTGRSGTSAFQIDSVASAQTIWDGSEAVAPLRDATEAENIILRDSIITAVAGHEGEGPQHRSSIHFHGGQSRGFLFSNLILGGAETGFYQDPNTHYDDIQISNVRSSNPGRAVWFQPGKGGQKGLMIRGLQHRSALEDGCRSIEIHGRDGAILRDCQLEAAGHADVAIELAGCQRVQIVGIQARAQGGVGIRLRDAAVRSGGVTESVQIRGAQLEGFETPFERLGKAPETVSLSDVSWQDGADPGL